ncbi:MAG: polysaccharide deacetylase family protein [Bacteroidota bacterium]|nr:polysaccharide deacetylase family protein [Bacteroidota bacterium]
MSAVSPQVISSGSRSKKIIALTFDACATSSPSHYDEKIVSILIESKTPATIFVCGKWAIEHQKEIKYLSKQSFFEIGNHSFIHPHCTKISTKRLLEEIHLTQDILFTLTGKQPHYFRPPYGEYNDSVVQHIAQCGLSTVEYDLPSGDPDTNATAKKLIEWVVRKAENGSVIVMHVNKRGWHSAEALPEIIDRLRKKGFTFATMSGLVQKAKAD